MRPRRWWMVAAFALVLALPSSIGMAVPTLGHAAAEKKDCTVFVTRTGNRYHKSYCSSLRKSRIPMSRSEAIKAGYTPCRRCGGSNCEE